MQKQLPVLIVDDLISMRQAMSEALHDIGIDQVLQALNGVEAIRILKTEKVAAVISDWKMPGLTGLDLLRWMRSDPALADVPFMMVTSESNPPQIRTAIQSGVSEYLIKPYTVHDFSNKVKRLVGGNCLYEMPLAKQTGDKVLGLIDAAEVEQRVSSSRVLIVDDMQMNIDLIAEMLKDEHIIQTACSGEEALRIAHSAQAPDLILLDVMMPKMDGHEVCRRLKADKLTRHIPVIFLTSNDEVDDVTRGLEIGAVDYVVKPAEPSILRARIRTHLRLKWAITDLMRQNLALADSARLREDVERMTQHDIKNPLSAVIAGTDMLLSDSSLSERQTQMAQAIRTHAWHSIDLLNQSLRLYRMESGTFVLQQEQVDLVTMLMRVRQETLATFADLKLDIRMTDAEGSTPELNTYIATGEEGLCYSLFGNLMRNAAEASPQNGSIHIQFSTEPESIVVAIRNSGMVPRTIRDRFFDKYVTAGKPDGSGLGTYTARLVTEAQNGTIAMSINEDNGTTTLVVRLPAR